MHIFIYLLFSGQVVISANLITYHAQCYIIFNQQLPYYLFFIPTYFQFYKYLSRYLQLSIALFVINSMKNSLGDNIKVFIRVRPFNEKQKQSSASSEPCVTVNGATIQMRDKQADHKFSFDHVFEGQSTQEQIYKSVGYEVVESAFQGFNGTVFAYGQTSSGKTHTCIGPDYTDTQKRGILPRMVNHIYEKIKQAQACIQFRIKISMVEIYMQKIKDLLDPSKGDLKIREKLGKGIYIQDVTEQYVASQEETIDIIKRGIVNRSVGQTNMNDTSSRSHMAFIITLYQNNLKDASAKSGKIILVDLAGSEKISKTGAEGKLLDEAKQINKSLLALGNVINSLTESKVSHIPYRDSKLTRLLQQSLGGNSKTNLIINVSPSELNEPETLSSLRFGNRAKQIKNKPKVNKEYTIAELLLLLEKAQKRIQQLQQMLGQMSLKKAKSMKKTSQIYVENLLDSDHPILQTDEGEHIDISSQNKQGKQKLQKTPSVNKSKIKQVDKSKLKLHFESECVDSSDQQKQKKQKTNEVSIIKSSHKAGTEGNIEIPDHTGQIEKLTNEKQILAEQIQLLNIEKVDLSRELDILMQKYEITVKENKTNQSKLAYLTRENEKLFEKLVSETTLLHENKIKVQQLQDKVRMYEQQILSIAALQQKQNPVSKIFGKQQSQASIQTKKIAQMIKNNKTQQNGFEQLQNLEQKIDAQIKANQQKDIYIKQLETKNKSLQQQIALFKNLEAAKEAFIEQKLKFGGEKERMLKDLQNRIDKVLQLQQKLDEEVERRKYFEQLINSEQSQKSRKIVLLQQHLNQVSQNYYVLKGQQSSWSKNNKTIEHKLESKNKRIISLQKQIISLKQQIQNLKIQVEDMEINPKQQSILDLDLSLADQVGERGFQKNVDSVRRPKIVKVVRSSNFRGFDGILG